MHLKIGVTFCCLLFILSCSDTDELQHIDDVDLSQPWVKSDPLSQNVGDLNEISIAAANLTRLTSLIVIRNGKLIHESYYKGFRPDSLHDVRSVTKSVLGLLVGIAISEGFISSIDEPIASYLSPDEYTLTDQQRSITINHLLTMSGGFQWNELGGNAYNEWALSGEPVNHLLDKPIVSEPGTTFNYNSAAVHLLGVTLAAATGMSLPDFALQYLFSKIGVEMVGWEKADEYYVNGGSGIRLKSLDMAKLGQLMLQGGKSGSEQILPAGWAASISMPAYSWRNNYAVLQQYTYGKLWWVHDVSGGPNYFAWGYGGQFIYVVPEKNLVVVTTTNWHFLSQQGGPSITEQEALNLILNQILPVVD